MFCLAAKSVFRRVCSSSHRISVSQTFTSGFSTRPPVEIPTDIDALDWRMIDRIPIRDQGESPLCQAWAGLTLLDYHGAIQGRATRAAEQLEASLLKLTEKETAEIKRIYKSGDIPCKFQLKSIFGHEFSLRFHKYSPDFAKEMVQVQPLLIMVKTGEEINFLDCEDPFDDGDEWHYKENEDGLHCMVLTGYFGEYLILQNSWGKNFGSLGFCYLNEKSKSIIKIATIIPPKEVHSYPKKGMNVIDLISEIKKKAMFERETDLAFEIEEIQKYLQALEEEIVKIEKARTEEKLTLIRVWQREGIQEEEISTQINKLEESSFEKGLELRDLKEDLKLKETELVIKKEKMRLLILRRRMKYYG